MIRRRSGDAELVEALLDAFGSLEPAARAMFGGHCVYARQVPVAIVHSGRAYLWIPEADRVRWQATRAAPFTSPSGQTLDAYHELPRDLIEDPDRLVDHAKAAINARRH